MIARSRLLPRPPPPCPRPLRPAATARRPFHRTAPRRDDSTTPDHYATLDLPPTASPADIKKQFYALSKAHHPDLHPADPHAAERFVRISEAHATLASPEARAKYDRAHARAHPHRHAHAHAHPSGSPHASAAASSPAGGRPASGLSRRRTQFRGPPPSFYRSGGWGEHGEKRAEHASQASHAANAQSQSPPPGAAGTGPGGFASGHAHDVPHFDRHGHTRTHSEIERTRHKARRKQWDSTRSADDGDREGGDRDALDYSGGSTMLVNFVVMCGVLVTIFAVSGTLFGVGGGGHPSSAAAAAAAGEKGRRRKMREEEDV
ncbi:hypothetical protein LTR08_007107 [Meristemomyces frigidus]|nr:hypothetical protein LTR08_007107 [Meristemomyces frigidus]